MLVGCVTHVPLLKCHLCLYTISNLLFYMLLSLLVQKKVTKETHPEKPPFGCAQSLEKIRPRINSLRSNRIRFPPDFPCALFAGFEGTLFYVLKFTAEKKIPDDFCLKICSGKTCFAMYVNARDIDNTFPWKRLDLSQWYSFWFERWVLIVVYTLIGLLGCYDNLRTCLLGLENDWDSYLIKDVPVIPS